MLKTIESTLKNLVFWLVFYVVSLVVDRLGWAEQGETFFWLYFGFSVFIALAGICLLAIAARNIEDNDERNEENGKITVINIVNTLIEIVILLCTIWLATLLFKLDFYVAFQIITFGQCLCVDEGD